MKSLSCMHALRPQRSSRRRIQSESTRFRRDMRLPVSSSTNTSRSPMEICAFLTCT